MTSACRCFWNSECKSSTKKAATEIVTAEVLFSKL